MQYLLYRLVFSSLKEYIGQTSRSMHLRLLQHARSVRAGSKLPVHLAWAKYGEPRVEVLGEFYSQEELHSAEIEAIRKFNTLSPNGYNLSFGGDTAPSKNPEVARKISIMATGRKTRDTTGISEASRRNWSNPDFRSKVLSGVKKSWTEDRRMRASQRAKEMWTKRHEDGWSMPAETREKLKATVVSDESRKKMSESAKGKPKAPRSKITRDKLSAQTKEAWKDPALRERRIAAIKAAWIRKRQEEPKTSP